MGAFERFKAQAKARREDAQTGVGDAKETTRNLGQGSARQTTETPSGAQEQAEEATRQGGSVWDQVQALLREVAEQGEPPLREQVQALFREVTQQGEPAREQALFRETTQRGEQLLNEALVKLQGLVQDPELVQQGEQLRNKARQTFRELAELGETTWSALWQVVQKPAQDWEPGQGASREPLQEVIQQGAIAWAKVQQLGRELAQEGKVLKDMAQKKTQEPRD
jgi:hypothetical protein